MYGTAWIASSILAVVLGVALASPAIQGVRAVKDDLHLATTTAASCQGLRPPADFPGIEGFDQAIHRLFRHGC
jgi:hypothetical protein